MAGDPAHRLNLGLDAPETRQRPVTVIPRPYVSPALLSATAITKAQGAERQQESNCTSFS